MCACNTNPLLRESSLEYGAPEFDKIKTEHYLPAFKQGIEEAKATVDEIIADPEHPTFENTVLRLENSGETLDRVAGIFFNIMEADNSDELQQIAVEVSPLLNEYEVYVSTNPVLFDRVKEVYEHSENLDKDQQRLTEKLYKSMVRGGALLSEEDKANFAALSEKLSLLQLDYAKNALAATNAYTLNVQDEKELAGLPEFLIEQAAELAQEKGQGGWTFDLSYPMYSPFMKYCDNRSLREQMYKAYASRACGGEFDNSQVVLDITSTRIEIAHLLGYKSYADYVLEERMLKSTEQVYSFLNQLLEPSLPVAKQEVKAVLNYARANGFPEKELQAWDFSYWSDKYQKAFYDFDEEDLKPYLELENCVKAVFDLAGRLYGLNFELREDLPVYHPDVKVYDVKDRNSRHMALFYVDFFPRASKRSGAWMTEFRGLKQKDGEEIRPLVSLVTNFTKPSASKPSLISHYELTTLLHEFGHSLNAILSEGRYGSLTTTNVSTDFVELPSQIMENWAFETEFLQSFAKHYQSGEIIPNELIEKIIATKNYNSAYFQVRQLNFGYLDMAWNTLETMTEQDVLSFEAEATRRCALLPEVEGACISTAFTHIFTGQYAAGYYSYKWSEVLEADAFSLFKEKGIFSQEVAESFRANILSQGNNEDPAVLFRRFRGRDPQPEALLKKLGITQ
ncbi:MAG: M3 family metallopeptidase [Candidatus Cryptobacteroides sp.]